jgi:hypothetical protein
MAKKKLPEPVKLIQEYTSLELKNDSQKSISYSQFSQFSTCKHQWYLKYVKKLGSSPPSIYTTFGTALHETIQEWLSRVYNRAVKEKVEVSLAQELLNKMKEVYKKERQVIGEEFSTSEELQEFWQDGVEILNYLERKRSGYFPIKNTYLVGVEIPILQNLKTNIYFKGFIDLVFYNSVVDKYLLVDIKTSTRGWSKYQKQDETKLSQLILYKEFFSRQFNVDIDKIDIQYFIVKRKVPDDPEFANMGRRVQEFTPPSGKIKRGKVLSQIEFFVKEAFTEEGEYRNKDYEPSPSKHTCMFCPFKEDKHLCKSSIF